MSMEAAFREYPGLRDSFLSTFSQQLSPFSGIALPYMHDFCDILLPFELCIWIRIHSVGASDRWSTVLLDVLHHAASSPLKADPVDEM